MSLLLKCRGRGQLLSTRRKQILSDRERLSKEWKMWALLKLLLLLLQLLLLLLKLLLVVLLLSLSSLVPKFTCSELAEQGASLLEGGGVRLRGGW